MMKKILWLVFFAGTLMQLAMVQAVAAKQESQRTLADRYQFEQFREVNSFLPRNLNSWIAVDSQSIMLRDSANTHYLVILKRKERALKPSNTIAIETRGSRRITKFERIHIIDHTMFTRPAQIAKIYRIEGKEARAEAIAQIRGNDKGDKANETNTKKNSTQESNTKENSGAEAKVSEGLEA